MPSRLTIIAALLGCGSSFATHGASDDDSGVTLATFDGADGTTFKWYAENDPVMGGLSHSNFTIVDDVGVFQGAVEIVPSLKAPGFCFLHSVGVGDVHSAKGQTHLELTLRNAGQFAEYESFKVSFAANTLSPQFKNFKADFNVSVDATNWTKVTIPFTDFSKDWNAATGEPIKTCAEDPAVCVTDHDLEHIYQFGVWAEGKAGQFHLEMQSIRAVTPAAATTALAAAEPVASADSTQDSWNNTCGERTQKVLRWNVSVADEYVDSPFFPPGGLPADESFADAICCDSNFKVFAEPPQFFAQSDVALFDKLNASGQTTFYDSVCGEPLFVAPVNRTFEEWRAESVEHGWPSFRDAEVLPGALKIDKAGGIVYSKCGTHLGSFAPDEKGDRYCLDLVCLSGRPSSL